MKSTGGPGDLAVGGMTRYNIIYVMTSLVPRDYVCLSGPDWITREPHRPCQPSHPVSSRAIPRGARWLNAL